MQEALPFTFSGILFASIVSIGNKSMTCQKYGILILEIPVIIKGILIISVLKVINKKFIAFF